MRVLIIGGSGRLGQVVVPALLDRNVDVQVLSRDPGRARSSVDGRAEVVLGDVRNAASIATAVAGRDVVVAAAHGLTGGRTNTPKSVDRDGVANIAAACAAARAELVLVSVLGSSAVSPIELFRMKHAGERAAVSSGVPLTIVRAAAFRELWEEILEQTAGRGGRPIVFGQGTSAVNFVPVADVAAAVVQAVVDGTTRGRTIDVAGEDLTMTRLAEAIQARAGRTTAPRHLPRVALKVAALTVGRLRADVGKQVRTALAMDGLDLSHPDSRP